MSDVRLTAEEARMVRVLLERSWPQINLRGTIQYFGLNGNHDEVRDLMDATESLCRKVGYEPPRPKPDTGGPRAA